MTKKFLTSSATSLPRRLRDDLYQANKLITDGQQEQALKILDALDDKFPRQPDVLGLMVNIHLDTNNQHGYLHTIYKLHEITPTKAEVKLGLAGAYLANGYPALALQTFRKFLKRWPQSEHVPDVIKTIHILEKELEKLMREKARVIKGDLMQKIQSVNGINFIGEKIDLNSADAIKDLAFEMRQQVENLVMVLGAEIGGKASLTLIISDELVAAKKLNAGAIIRDLAKEIQGGGGGQPFFATSGGNNPAGITNALSKASALVASLS